MFAEVVKRNEKRKKMVLVKLKDREKEGGDAKRSGS